MVLKKLKFLTIQPFSASQFPNFDPAFKQFRIPPFAIRIYLAFKFGKSQFPFKYRSKYWKLALCINK